MLRQEGTEALEYNKMHLQQYNNVPSNLGYLDGGNYPAQWSDNFPVGGNFVPPQGSGPSGGGGQPMRMHHQTIQVTTQGPAQPTPTSTPPGPPADMKQGSHMQPQPPQMSQGVAPMVVTQQQPRPPSAQSFAHNYQSTRVTSQRITNQRPVLSSIPHVQYPHPHVLPVVPVPSNSQHVIIQQVSPMTMSYQGQNRNQNQNQMQYYSAPPHFVSQPQAYYPNPQNTQYYLRYNIQGNVASQQQNAQQNQIGPAGFSNSGSMLQSAQAQGTGCPQDKRKRTNAVPIINPDTGKSIFDTSEPPSGNNTPSRSSESSARETPQPSSGHTPDDKSMAADFAARVAKVAADVSITEISNGQPQLENISDQSSDSDMLHKTHIVPSTEIKINPNVLPSAIKADTDFVQRTGIDQATCVTQEEQENRDESQPPLIVTPTVSAVTSVEILRDRQNKEQFPALAKTTHSSSSNQLSQSPVRTNSRKQRNSESEKQSSSPVVVSNAISSVSVGAHISSVDASGTNKKSQKSVQKEEIYAPPKERREKSRSLSKEQSPPVATEEVTTVPAIATTLPQPNTKAATQVSSFQESVSIKNIPAIVPLLNSSAQSVLQVEEKVSLPSIKQQANGEAHTDTQIEGKQPTQQQRGKSKKNAKMRGDLNKRGVEKEGTDMDAFTESSLTVEERDGVSPVPAQSNNNKMGTQTLPAQVPPPVNEQIMDNLENQEEKIVAAKNEENAKVSAVQPIQNEKSENEPPPAVIEKPTIPPMTLRHSYKEDQWSPVNPEGKKKYERDFLLELQNEPQSRKKPENLPDVEAVLKDTSNRRAQGSMSFQVNRNQDTFVPLFAKSNSQRGVIKRSSQQGKIKPGKPNVIHMSLSLHEDVKLKETENAWKPTRFIQNAMTEEEKETQELFKKVRGILNKLTPQKFDTLTLQLKQLPINSLPRLQGVIDLIFEKAVDEPNFSKAYANMCKILQMLEVQHNKETVKFRNLLITRCQHEFEGNKLPEIDAEKRSEGIRNCADPEKKKELQANVEEEERRIRMKSVGNIRFIGELFKLNMLTVTIMLRCINHLLSNEEEESLECLCKLLTTIGKDLESTGTKDNPKLGAEALQSVFQSMSVLAQKRDNSKISSRVRFMLQDVIELRQKNWVPRRDDNNPKTIDQIQKEAERETMEMNIALSQPRNKIHDSRQDSDRKGRGNRSNNPNDESWQTVTSNKGYRSNSYFETSRLQCVKDDMNITSLGSSVQFRSFVPGGGSKASDSKQENKSFYGPNLYQYLQKASPSDERKSQSSMMNNNRKLTPSPSLEKERFYAHPKDSIDGGQMSRGSSLQRERQQQLSQPPSRDSSVSRSNITPSIQSRQPSALPELTEEQIKRKTKNIFEEYVSLHNIQESRTCIEEAFTNVNIHRFLRSVLDLVTECKNSQTRGEIGKFISELMGQNVISKQLFIDELSNMFECSEDVAIDVPLFWDYLAELIVPALSEDQITFADIRTAGSSFVKTSTAGKLLKPLFILLVKDKDQEFVRSRMVSSKITLEDFLPVTDVENFIKQNGLEYLREGNTSGALTMNQIQKQILEYARNNKTYDDITDWITTCVGENVNSTQFIRALITAICEASVNSNKHLDKAKFKSFTNLIFRYFNNLEEYELAGLSAIQAFVTKLEHPSGLLMDIFTILWEDNMFSNESFLKWRGDGEETEGKGVCVKSLTSFFVALSESYSEDETS